MAGVSQRRDGQGEDSQFGWTQTFDDDCDVATPTDNIDNGPTMLVQIQEISSAGATTYFLGFDHENPVEATTPPDYQLIVADSSTTTVVVHSGGKMDVGFSFACGTTGGSGWTGAPTTPPDIHLITRPEVN